MKGSGKSEKMSKTFAVLRSKVSAISRTYIADRGWLEYNDSVGQNATKYLKKFNTVYKQVYLHQCKFKEEFKSEWENNQFRFLIQHFWVYLMKTFICI